MHEILLNWGSAGALLLIVAGMVVLVFGGESLIRGATRLAMAMNISPLIVGLTVVAFGTSAPELALSLNAALNGKADLAVGNVIGSNICNICLILGLAALLKPIVVSSSLIRREIPMAIGFSILVYFFALSGGTGPWSSVFDGKYEGRILPWEGALFFGSLLVYVGWTIYEVLFRRQQNEKYVKELEDEVSTPEKKQREKVFGFGNLIVNICYLIVGIALLVAGADMLVQGSVHLARSLGVSELIIGLTILAAGTSLPELVVSVMAAVRGKSDIAVGNVVGSNVFNLLGVLGPTAMVASGGLAVTPKALQFDIPLMILFSIFCIVICITGRRVSRGEGVFLLLCYAAYVVFLCFSETL